MNLSGILVVAKPQFQAEVVESLNALPGAQVRQVDAASGRIVVVQEGADIHAEIDAIKRIKALPHVIMAEMVYHYLADDAHDYDTLPAELQDAPDAVPSCLNA